MTLIMRGQVYYLKKRVPVRFARVEPREVVWMPLDTDSLTVAKDKSRKVWETMISAWEAKLAGDTTDAEQRFAAARDLARLRGYRFVPVDQVARLPLQELLDRIDAAFPKEAAKPNMIEAAAVLGGAAKPEIRISRALDLYFEIARDKTLNKSADQIRRWENPRKKAIANFIAVNGDLLLREITADHMLDFKDWWLDRIEEEDLTPNSANKDFTHFGTVVQTVNTQKRLGLPLPVSGYAIPAGDPRQRISFSEEWIKTKIVGNPDMMKMNQEARGILLGMVNTGYRPSEGASLSEAMIRLDAKIPHISIEPNGRELKTPYSRRVIPLAGVSLEAFRENPQGFPRYHDNAGLSATINKFMRENGMMETEAHVLYGLRHSFEDRMLDRDVDERIRRDLMGHTLNRQRYGKGASLEKLHEIIKSIAL